MGGDELTGTRSVVFVLGMHRSGTSALARMLSLLGCDLPKTLMPESLDNARGYWESLPVTHLNEAILSSGGSHWDDWLPFNPNWYRSPVYANFVERGRSVIKDEFGSSALFVLKDPRCARLVPYWNDVFVQESITPLVLIPIRNPVDVSSSISSRDHIFTGIVHLLWLRHVLDAEYNTRGMARAFTTYEKLLTNWTELAVQLQDRLGIVWPSLSVIAGEKVEEFLDPSIRHHATPSENILANPLLGEWLRDTYAIMLRWSLDGEQAADYQQLNAIKQGFDAAGPAFTGITQALRNETTRSMDLQAVLGRTDAAVASQAGEIAALQNALESTRTELVAKDVQILALANQSAAERDAAQIVRQADSTELTRTQAETLDLRNTITSLEDVLLQRNEQIERSGSEAREVSQRADALEAEKRAIEAKLNTVEHAAREQQEELRATAAAAQQANADVRALRDQLAYVESTLRQREEEIAQTGSDRAQAYEQIELLGAEKRKIEHKLVDANAWVLRLAEERSHAQAQIDRLQSDLNAKARELGKVAASLARASGTIARLHEKNAAARAEIEQYRREQQALAALHENGDGRDRLASAAVAMANPEDVAARDDVAMPEEAAAREDVAVPDKVLAERTDERIREIAQLSSMLLEKQNQVADLATRQGDLESLAEQRLGEIEQMRAVSGELRASNDRLNAEMKTVHAAKAALEASARQHRSEISALSTKLLHEQRQVAKTAQEAEWLRRVIPVMTRTRWWDKVVTKAWLARRNHNLLRRKGLFDADDYIARYPDVANEDIDPVLHFIRYGMSEGRVGMMLQSDRTTQ